jgi:beta-mannosidase
MAPLAVGMKRYDERTFPQPHSVAVYKDSSHVDVWACNSFLVAKEVLLVVEAFELLSGERIYVKEEQATLESNRSTELTKVEVPVSKANPDAAIVVSAKIVDLVTKEVISRFLTCPEP